MTLTLKTPWNGGEREKNLDLITQFKINGRVLELYQDASMMSCYRETVEDFGSRLQYYLHWQDETWNWDRGINAGIQSATSIFFFLASFINEGRIRGDFICKSRLP